jgi:hypothetical protein
VSKVPKRHFLVNHEHPCNGTKRKGATMKSKKKGVLYTTAMPFIYYQQWTLYDKLVIVEGKNKKL